MGERNYKKTKKKFVVKENICNFATPIQSLD